MKKIIQGGLLVIVGVLLLAVWDGLYILEEGQQAVVTQFGAPVGEPRTEAGLQFKIPFIQKTQFFEERILIWDGEPNQIPTNDKTFIFMDSTARWKITDALQFLQAVGTEARAQSLLDDIINGTVRDFVNKNNLIEIIRSSDWTPDYMLGDAQSIDMFRPPELGRDKISALVLESAGRITPKYGIELVDVLFKRVNYIESVRLTVYQRMISERQRIAAEKRATGEGRKAEILGRVDREYRTITSTAQREATEIKGAADAKVTRIYGEAFSLNPEFFSFQKSLESYRHIVGPNTSLILSSQSDLFRYLENMRQPHQQAEHFQDRIAVQ